MSEKNRSQRPTAREVVEAALELSKQSKSASSENFARDRFRPDCRREEGVPSRPPESAPSCKHF